MSLKTFMLELSSRRTLSIGRDVVNYVEVKRKRATKKSAKPFRVPLARNSPKANEPGTQKFLPRKMSEGLISISHSVNIGLFLNRATSIVISINNFFG